ncbi:MAG: hypothetical protein HZY75_11425 [Nocardioidaceae bacterium]|nr:MAG: hypothetical protein HZY75_11425 [Nocardioidaceae bacterium]
MLDVEGTEATSTHSETTFSSQSDAESWLGETYGELLTEGIEQVTLYEGDAEVYGPMSLRP